MWALKARCKGCPYGLGAVTTSLGGLSSPADPTRWKERSDTWKLSSSVCVCPLHPYSGLSACLTAKEASGLTPVPTYNKTNEKHQAGGQPHAFAEHDSEPRNTRTSPWHLPGSPWKLKIFQVSPLPFSWNFSLSQSTCRQLPFVALPHCSYNKVFSYKGGRAGTQVREPMPWWLGQVWVISPPFAAFTPSLYCLLILDHDSWVGFLTFSKDPVGAVCLLLFPA